MSGRSFPWASVTKPATALAVLVAVEEGTLALDEPAGPPGSTVRHLLAHASGLGPDPGPPIESPGVRRIYSNAGFQELALILEARSGMSFADYLAAGGARAAGHDRHGADRVAVRAPPPDWPDRCADLVALGREWARPRW